VLWADLGLERADVEIEVYYKDGCQPLLWGKVTEGPGVEQTPDSTPEPATMLILGLGVIGAGFAARRRVSK
jgi:hypothetical protein